MELVVGGVTVIPVVLGLVELSKGLGLKGVWLRLEAMVIATALGILVYAATEGLLSSVVLQWLGIILGSLALGLSACGLYDISRKFRPGA